MNKTLIMATATTLALATACAPKADDSAADTNIIGKTQIVADKMTAELLQELGKVSELQASPDGTKVLYGVGYTSIKDNKGNRELFVMNADGSDNHAITHTAKSESNAVWSLDGQSIYFLSSESGSSQMWQMNADGTGRKQISEFDRDIEGFVLSPDQKQVILIAAIPVARIDSSLFEGLDRTTGRLWDEMNYRHWDNFVDDYPHPYLCPIADGKVNVAAAKDMLEGEPYECPMRPFGGTEAFAWTPDGSKIVYVCRKETGTQYAFSTRSSLYLYDVATGKAQDLHATDHGYDNNPAFNADGSLLAFTAMARNGYESDKNALCVLNMADGTITDLTANYDNDVNEYTWAPDGQSLTFTSYSYGSAPVFNVNLSGEVTRLSSEKEDYDYASPCYVGENLLVLRHDYHHPNEVFALANNTASQLTHENDEILAKLGDMGRVEKRWMTCTNGDQMLVWVAYPAGFDAKIAADPSYKVPTLLFCEGGPESAVSQFWSTRWNVAIMQAMGYAVVLPNRHGVPGFGQAYKEQIAGDFNGQCMKDYLTAIDAVAKESWCDADRLAAVGASFGGYSVYYLAGHHDKRFKCFIAHCGIFNCESMYGETEEMWFADWDYGGPYYGNQNTPGLTKNAYNKPMPNGSYTDSPHKSVAKWDTPILVIHNEHDYRIPVTQGMQAFNIARMRGIPAEFLYFPDECHWVLKPQNAVLWQRVYFDWLNKWLGK